MLARVGKRRARIRRFFGVCALLLGLRESNALSQEATPAVTAGLQLDAARSCASSQDLVAGVGRRSSRIRLVESTTATPLLQTSLRPAADGSISAELVVIHAGGHRSLRRLSAPTCAEAVDALALVIAITLDPASVSGGANGARGANASGEAMATGGSASSSTTKSGAVPVDARGSEPPGGESPADDSSHLGGTRATAARFLWHVGAGAGALFGPAPQLMPGVVVEFLAAWDGAGLWSPAVRVSGAYYWLSGLSEPGGVADFELDAGSLDLCPVRVGTGVLAVRVCVNAQAGRLLAQGSRTFAPQSRSRPFAVLGGSSLVTALLSQRLAATLALSAGRTLVEDEFVLASNVFYRVPKLSAGLGLGLALAFR